MSDGDAIGAEAVRWAREAIREALGFTRGRPLDRGLPEIWREPRGVFVTLRRYPSAELRGCIGFPRPTRPLLEALREAAVAAALDDPRFPPIRPHELGRLTVEVSILTAPEPIAETDPAARLSRVRVGVDGLILERHRQSGLLLPQVAVEQGWSAEAFLRGVSEKAGFSPTAWADPETKLYRFQASIASERSPGGEITVGAPGPERP
ncbi:MAG: TIGR00296 family protein [Thermoplasmata archaeon]